MLGPVPGPYRPRAQAYRRSSPMSGKDDKDIREVLRNHKTTSITPCSDSSRIIPLLSKRQVIKAVGIQHSGLASSGPR